MFNDSETIDGKEIAIFFGKNGYAERVGLNTYMIYSEDVKTSDTMLCTSSDATIRTSIEETCFGFDSEFVSLACSVVSLMKLNLIINNYKVEFLDPLEDIESKNADFVVYELTPFFISFEITEKGKQILHCIDQKKIEELKRKFKAILSLH